MTRQSRFKLPRSARAVSAVLFLLGAAAPLRAQGGLPDVVKPETGSVSFGETVVSGGDADGDGIPDLVIADPGVLDAAGRRVGRWAAYSGRTRRIIWTMDGCEVLSDIAYGHEYNISAAFVGDLNGDRCDEIIVGRPAALDSFGVAEIYSGRTGEMLYRFEGNSVDDRLGVEVACVGDVNHDGQPDFAFVGRYEDYEETPAYVSIRSGRDASELHRVEGSRLRRIRAAGDLDGDDHDDVLIGNYRNDPHLLVVSGRLGGITRIEPPMGPLDEHFAYAIAGGRDITGDDVPDILVSGNDLSGQVAWVISGESLEFLHHLPVPLRLLLSIAFADINGDGEFEAILGVDKTVYAVDWISGRVLYWVGLGTTHYGLVYGNQHAIGDFNADGCDDLAGPVAVSNQQTREVRRYGGGSLLLSPSRYYFGYRVLRGLGAGFEIHRGTPGRRIALLASYVGSGCTFIQQLGICIDLDRRIHRLATARTDESGFASYTFHVPPNLPLGPIWLQALDPADPKRGPIKSNVILLEVVD